MFLLHSTWLCITYNVSTSLYLTLLPSTIHGSTLLSILLWHGSTSLYITLPWLYFTILDSKWLYHGSTWLYLTLPDSTMTLLHCTSLYISLPWFYLPLLDSKLLYNALYSNWLCITFHLLYFIPLYFHLYHCSTSPYLTVLPSTMAPLHSTFFLCVS